MGNVAKVILVLMQLLGIAYADSCESGKAIPGSYIVKYKLPHEARTSESRRIRVLRDRRAALGVRNFRTLSQKLPVEEVKLNDYGDTPLKLATAV
ncbi:MAG: hypothetical protein KDD62_15670, partial [Bdellovibrionales bacterium]|nr:hypothetical protein [Bdellovibrionales bacterium]